MWAFDPDPFLGIWKQTEHAWIDLIQYAKNIFWTVGKFYQQIRVNRATLLQNGQRWETFKKKDWRTYFRADKRFGSPKRILQINNKGKIQWPRDHHKTCSFHQSWQVKYFQHICLMGILILINLKCFDKGLFTSVPLNFGEWHLVMQIWSHFVLNVHYMPAYDEVSDLMHNAVAMC